MAVHYGEELKNGIDIEDEQARKKSENFKEKARKVIERLKGICEKGAIVFADYSDLDYTSQKGANIGIIEKGKSYQPKTYPGEWETRDGKLMKSFIYEQAELSNYRKVPYADFPQFLAIHPRGSTVVQWHNDKPVKFIYKRMSNLPIDTDQITFDVLFPAQQEVLCSEYLRLKAPKKIRLKHLLIPVGRGMKTIDIDGITDYKRILAQVSYTKSKTEVKKKTNELINLKRDSNFSKKIALIYFGPKESEKFVLRFTPKIEFIALNDVFDAMKDTGILDAMLGIDFPK